ncbi:hypothetical protein [Streptomyces sp. 135]|uniref:hypothetical protein n=1 Tax=Streptomyces sp. 135 TaxID=2838850 RepID=UPI001CBD3A5F|nr:hypothetical protein [Streptomyces sp. 135]
MSITLSYQSAGSPLVNGTPNLATPPLQKGGDGGVAGDGALELRTDGPEYVADEGAAESVAAPASDANEAMHSTERKIE